MQGSSHLAKKHVA